MLKGVGIKSSLEEARKSQGRVTIDELSKVTKEQVIELVDCIDYEVEE